jgi:choline dehydrogenase-like flavoprotein
MSTHYDIIIIGTGPGGGTLAYKLAASGKKILLLERGGYLPREKDNWSSKTVFIDNKYKAKETWKDKNGVLVLASVTGGDREHSVPADKINLDFVLGNKLVVGTVNANREYFEAGVYDFARAELEFPGWLPKLLTHPVTGLENFQEMMQTLTTEGSAIKVFVNVAYE